MDDVKIVDRELYSIFYYIPTLNLLPTNYEKEKEKIFKDKTYNPKFKYSKLRVANKIKDRLRNLKINLRDWNKIFFDRKKELIDYIKLLENIGTPAFVSLSDNLWKRPSIELVSKAHKLLNLSPDKSSMKYNYISAVKKISEYLKEKGYRWQIRERELVADAMTNYRRRTLYLNKNKKHEEACLKRLIVHEVDTHIARAENGGAKIYKLFFVGFPSYLRTEEGLAVYNEERMGVSTNNTWRHYAGRVIAIDLACKNSFSTVYNELLEFFPKETAWNLTVRAKRGLADTSRPGAYTKDSVYLDGYYTVKDFIRRGGSIKDLYLGKIGIEHVKAAKEMLMH